MFWYESGWRPKFRPAITVFPDRNARTRGVAYSAGLAADVLEIGKREMAGQTQGHRVDRAAGIPCERSRESHWPPAFPGPGPHVPPPCPVSRAAGPDSRGGGPQVHAMKVGFEKYYLRKSRHGYVRLP